MSSSNDDASSQQWIVVETTYPTTYGCNRGRSWSRAALIVRTDRSRSDRTYTSRDEAVEDAREKRNEHEIFQLDENYYSDTDEPPWDSADLQNWDNDEEVRIEVMTVAEFEREQADDAAYVRRERMRCQYEGTIGHVMLGMQIKDAGRVFYTRPPSPELDIKAELEIFDYEVEDDGVTEKKGGSALKAFDIPANASSIKSLMYKGGEAFDKFTREFRYSKIDEGDDHATAENLEASLLLRILKACTSLEELHIKCTKYFTFISPVLVSKMLSAAPHLKSLKVLSIRSPLQLVPDALLSISEFERLERLDISDAFSSEFYQDNYDYQSTDDYMTEQTLPYDNQLMECINSLKNLKRLDLGFGDDESKRYLFDYMLGSDVVSELTDRSSYENFKFTMNDQAVPEEWNSATRKKAARCHALVKVFGDDSVDQDIRAMAVEELKTCPTCAKPAEKRCTRCMRQFYCSVACQKADYKVHKRLCLECFD